ncbi:Exportin-1 [Fasciola hepatica]|uniref:Exportin-1 n=1 Tax=Fasciola hepatica TaxID=6192 RepID=A0A4E0RYL2_FASHE|nr:Exportin-1 [Fasciola hepatica]
MPPAPAMGVISEVAANQLLDFSQRLDIGLLDRVVNCMYHESGAQQKMAEKILNTLKEHPDAWMRVDSILEYSSNQETKYFALQILESLIKTRWKVLDRPQCEGIKKYIVGLIIQTSSSSELIESEKTYLGKLNMILVEILKHEWPNNWPTFISDIVGASKTNETLCQNNMVILRLLSEEVFDFSLGQMTQAKAKHLKDSMCQEFGLIFQLCQFVLDNSQNASLVVSTLETLLRFMHWIPLGYIFETNLIQTLVYKFFTVPLFRNVTLKCLAEMAGVLTDEYNSQLLELFVSVTQRLTEMLPLDTKLKSAYECGTSDEQNFIQNLAIFYTTFLKCHSILLEKPELFWRLQDAYTYLLMLSEVEEREIFKICLEYWGILVADHHREAGTSDQRSKLLAPVLSKLRRIMISRMARPEEVLVVENEHGEVVREFMKDTDSLNLYKSMREILVYLTHLDYADTKKIMIEKLQNQVDGSEWSWHNLNTLCWAIGSISGAMQEEDERGFLVIVIRDLLGLCEQKKGKDNKAIVASNIMYVVGQYPRFLRAHWRFLKTVITKLFEFMHETHEGVQDMACDTFIKIAQKCRRQMVNVQYGEAVEFVEEILKDIDIIINDLHSQQVHTFYEAVGIIISAQTDAAVRGKQIERLFRLPNQIWDGILSQASINVDILKDPEVVKQLCNILKTNHSACKSLGQPYLIQLIRIYFDMLNVYKIMSQNIGQAVAANGEQVTKQPLIKSMRSVKKAILNVLSCWIRRTHDAAWIAEVCLPPLLDAVADDYQRNVPAARESEVLALMTNLVNRLEEHILPSLPRILDAVFQSTLEMIDKDLEEYPEHRTNFFSLLEAVNSHCFSALLALPTDKFKLILDSVIWAIKHTMRQVSETGLNILNTMLVNMSNAKIEQRQVFFKTFYMDILQHMFAVITDRSQTGHLTLQSTILAFMFKLVENDVITEQLGEIPIPNYPPGTKPNVQFVHQSLHQLLKQVFPHLQDTQIRVFIDGLFSFDQDVAAFREHVRDFLVQIREVAGEDLSDLYLEEREAEIAQAQAAKLRRQAGVPGILGPHEVDMCD